jgi:hypothetical protein
MEEACLMGFSGGLEQGKLVSALLELTKCHINNIQTGQSKTLIRKTAGPLKNVQFCSSSRKMKILTTEYIEYFED